MTCLSRKEIMVDVNPSAMAKRHLFLIPLGIIFLWLAVPTISHAVDIDASPKPDLLKIDSPTGAEMHRMALTAMHVSPGGGPYLQKLLQLTQHKSPQIAEFAGGLCLYLAQYSTIHAVRDTVFRTIALRDPSDPMRRRFERAIDSRNMLAEVVGRHTLIYIGNEGRNSPYTLPGKLSVNHPKEIALLAQMHTRGSLGPTNEISFNPKNGDLAAYEAEINRFPHFASAVAKNKFTMEEIGPHWTTIRTPVSCSLSEGKVAFILGVLK